MAQNAVPPGWRPGGERLSCARNSAHDKPEIAANQDVADFVPVSLRETGDPGALECPRCRNGQGWLHHQTVEVFSRREDAEMVSRVTVNGTIAAQDYLPNALSGNPSARRDGLRVHFWCEFCGDGLTLNIAQHKGVTLLDWTIGPGRGR